MNRDKLHQAIRDAVEEQILPKIFTPEQLAEMRKPFHDVVDFYNLTNLRSTEKVFAPIAGVLPQVAINHPDITAAQLATAPKFITVTLDDKKITVPLNIFKVERGTAEEWQETRTFNASSRKAIASIEQGLKEKFNLKADKDYNIGFGTGAPVDGKVSAFFMLQLFNKKSEKAGPEAKKFMEQKLATLMPERPFKVVVAGPE